ncbi:MAG: hypothetical protein HYZ61_01565 [Candidatus Andersenbacteria bacterium]|nr:hypothetical protein [Candidatus Andersenbacteria bacterium]
MKKTWFVSHPSGSTQHTPMFFNAVNDFAKQHPEIEFKFPQEEKGNIQKTKDDIASATLILVEVSIPSTGSGIELGWANASGVPIIAFHQGGAEPSPAVQFATKNIHVYVTEEHIVEVLNSLA